ncbi:MAG: DUF4920 domain-containing protein [Phycisphaeraceae bacterium]
MKTLVAAVRRLLLVTFAAALAGAAGCQTVGSSQSAEKSGSASAANVETWQDFGGGVACHETSPVTASALLADIDSYDGKHLRVSGTVSSVCQKRGCWLAMHPKGRAEPIFVKFTCPIEGRLIPAEAEGKHAVVEGEVSQREITESYARHLKEDAGASAEEIEAIKGPQTVIFIASPAARVFGLTPQAEGDTQ